MTNKRRLRLIGLLGALALPLAIGAVVPATAIDPSDPNLGPCTSVPGNLVRNCSFEAPISSGVVPGWEALVANDSGIATPSAGAHSGSHALRLASTTTDDVWTQTVRVSPHTKYAVGAWVESFQSSAPSPDDDLTITVTNVGANPGTGTVIYHTADTTISSWLHVGQLVTTAGGTSMTITIAGKNVPSSVFVDDVFVVAQPPGCAPIANNAVKNCGFEASSTAPWVHSVSASSGISAGISYGGDHSLFLPSSGTSDVWYQVVTVRPHTTYTLRYSDWYWSNTSAPNNDLTISVSNAAVSGGQLKVTTKDVANHWWRQVTRTFTTGAGSSAVLMLTGRNAPGITRVDDFSLTVAPKLRVAKSGTKVVTTLTGLGGQAVWLQKKSGSHWKLVHVFVAPKSGVAKAWALKVPKGTYRAVAKSAPGYVQVTSNSVKR